MGIIVFLVVILKFIERVRIKFIIIGDLVVVRGTNIFIWIIIDKIWFAKV